MADNLIKCNHYFNGLANTWKARGMDARDTHVRVGQRFTRISFQMVAGGQVFNHPAARTRDYVLSKLVTFHAAHHTPADAMLADLRAVVEQLPAAEHAAEAQSLRQQCTGSREGSGPQRLGTTLAELLVRLAGAVVQSGHSGGQ